jgi:Holliday junction resolvase
MSNGSIYRKGVRFERELVNDAKSEGLLAFRSAGSHSPVDVCIVDKDQKIIRLIQCKHTNKPHRKLRKEFEDKGLYNVFFELIEK